MKSVALSRLPRCLPCKKGDEKKTIKKILKTNYSHKKPSFRNDVLKKFPSLEF
jgi:hypothetical protein